MLFEYKYTQLSLSVIDVKMHAHVIDI